MNDRKLHFETLQIHGGYHVDESNARGIAIHPTAAYHFPTCDYAANLFTLSEPGYIYTRPRARPGACCSGVGGVRGGRAGVSRLESGRGSCGSSTARPATRGAARWPDLQGRAKGRRSARLLGRPEPTATVSGPISLKAPDLV